MTRLTPRALHAWREARGWTTDAAATWYGCDRRSWQRYEAGTRRIPQPLAVRVAQQRRPR